VVSADAGNAAVLGTDTFIYVPSSTAVEEVIVSVTDPGAATVGLELWYDPDGVPTPPPAVPSPFPATYAEEKAWALAGSTP
jgi:hypothetical protein